MTCPESAKGAIQGGVDAWRESGRGWIDGCRAAWPVLACSLAAPGAGPRAPMQPQGQEERSQAEPMAGIAALSEAIISIYGLC